MNSLAETGFKPAFPPCKEPMAKLLEAQGYECVEMFVHYGQKNWVYQRDLWEAQVVVRTGKFNDGFEQYCQAGNLEAIS